MFSPGHSAGGLVTRLYASTYPDDVVGMVLLDSTHEDVWHRFQQGPTPAQWKEFEAQTVTNQELLDAYPESGQWWTALLPDTPSVIRVRMRVGLLRYDRCRWSFVDGIPIAALFRLAD